MKKQILFLLTLTTFLFSSCRNLFENSVTDNSGSYAESTSLLSETSSQQKVVTVTGSIILDGAFPSEIINDIKAARTANPATPIFNDITTLTIKAVNVNDENDTVAGEPSTDKTYYTINIPLENPSKTYKILSSASNSSGEILTGESEEFSITEETPVAREDIKLHAISDNNSTGTIRLEVQVETGTEISQARIIKERVSNNAVSSAPFIFEVTNCTCGSYPITFEFLSANGELLYSFVQNVNVFKNLTTNRWTKNGDEPYFVTTTTGGVSSTTCKLTAAMVNAFKLTQIYLDCSYTTDPAVIDKPLSAGTGTFLNPCTTFDSAVEKVKDSSKDYTIHVKGSFQGCFTLPDTLDSKMNSLTIIGDSGLNDDGSPKDKLYGWASDLVGDEKDFNIIMENSQYSTWKTSGKIKNVLTVSTVKPVTINNLEISDGLGVNAGGIYITAGSVTLQEGVVIKDNRSSKGGGGINVVNSSLKIYGAKITGNSTYHSNGNSMGGGILLSNGAHVDFFDGEISLNQSSNTGGGVAYYCNDNTSISDNEFRMYGGKICSNEANGITPSQEKTGWGGGLNISDGKFIMTGGEISGNISNDWVGGIMLNGQCTLKITGGVIKNNTAVRNNGIYVNNLSTIEIGGSAYIPAGESGTHDIYLDHYDSNGTVRDAKISLCSPLTRHNKANPIKLTPQTYVHGREVVIADGTNVTNLTPYKDCFALSNEDTIVRIPSGDNSKLVIDMPFFVKQGGTPTEAGVADGTRNKPYPALNMACASMNNEELDYTIFVLGTLRGRQFIPNTTHANSITIKGATGLYPEDDANYPGEPKDVLDGEQCSYPVLDIQGGVENNLNVILESIKITGGNNSSDTGGGVFVLRSTVTLGADVLITGNKAPHGAGVYVSSTDGILKIRENVVVKNNLNTVNAASNIYLPTGKTITVEGPLVKTGDSSKKAEIGVSSEESPTLSNSIAITEGYGYLSNGNNEGVRPSTYFKGDAYAVTDTAGEAVFAVGSGSFYSAKDFELGSISVNKLSGVAANYFKINEETTYILKPNFTRQKPNSGTIPLYYNPADKKLYENYDAETGIYSSVEANGAEVSLKPELYYNSSKINVDCVLSSSVQNDLMITVPAIPIEGDYKLMFYAEYLGIGYDKYRNITGVTTINLPKSENDSVYITDPEIDYIVSGKVKGGGGIQISYSGKSDATVDITFSDFVYRVPIGSNYWDGMVIKNNSEGTTFTVHLILDGGHTVYGNGNLNPGLKIDGVGNIVVVFDTNRSSGGNITFGTYSAASTTPDIRVYSTNRPVFRIAEGCTFTGKCTGIDTTYTDIDEFFAEAESKRHNNGYAADGSTIKITK